MRLLTLATHSLFTQLTYSCTEYSHATKHTDNMAVCHGRGCYLPILNRLLSLSTLVKDNDGDQSIPNKTFFATTNNNFTNNNFDIIYALKPPTTTFLNHSNTSVHQHSQRHKINQEATFTTQLELFQLILRNTLLVNTWRQVHAVSLCISILFVMRDSPATIARKSSTLFEV